MEAETQLENVIKSVYENMAGLLDEKQLRMLSASIAKGYGYGGITKVHRISGLSRSTIHIGRKELENRIEGKQRIREAGGGRKLVEEKTPEIITAIQEIIGNNTYGNPEKVISYTSLSLRKIADILGSDYSIQVSHVTVGEILESLGYSKQLNQKMMQVGEPHPDRNAQFEYINAHTQEFLSCGDPVISVDTKKKENIGNFKNSGSEYCKKGEARKVLDHDFPLKELGKVSPYGVYNLNKNTGFINLGTSHDTGEFAVESIRRWWSAVGKNTFPAAKRIYITCDGGGSNSSRSHQWKFELAKLAQETGLEIHVSHFPPGTSKWNKIEHRLFCYISKNWHGKPLIDIETTVNLIGSTTTTAGLKVICQVDHRHYDISVKIPDEDFDNIDISTMGPNEAWNCIIKGFTV